MKLKNVQITIMVVGSILVSVPFIARKVEQYNYVRQLTKIEEYVTQISDSKGKCMIELKENVIESDCAESLKLNDHIMIEPITLNYIDGIFEGDAVTLISSKKYPQQYCMGFSGFMVAIGYYEGQCNNFQNP